METGKVRIVWRDFPWIGEESRVAAQAARCAGNQGKFWEYHDYLFAHQRGENQGQFGKANLKNFAQQLALDGGAFGQCLDAGADLDMLRGQVRTATASGLRGTPSFKLNGQLLGSGTYEQFARAIDQRLAGR